MSSKSMIILLGLFIILLAAASAPWWSGPLGLRAPRSVEADLGFSAVTPEWTEEITIRKGGQQKRLVKGREGWSINGFKASGKEVEDLFEVIGGLRVESLVSRNPANHGGFDATEEKGYVVTFSGGGASRTYLIGRRGPGPGSFYAKKEGSERLYLVSGRLLEKLSQDVTAWRDRVVLAVPPDSVRRIEIASGPELLTITRTEEGKWQAEASGRTVRLEEQTAGRLLSALASLEASGFLQEEEVKEFSKAGDRTVLRVFGAGGERLAEVSFVKGKGGTHWWAHPEGGEFFYRVPSYRLADVLLKKEEVMKD